MADITEIAPEIYRLSIYEPAFDLQFNQFLVRDDEPLLYHTGMRQQFGKVRDAVAQLIDPTTLRWIGFSHFEPDECGSLNEWLQLAPHAQAVTGEVGAAVFIDDFADRAPRVLANDAVLPLGAHRVRFRHTPHLPHGWDAGMLFEEAGGVLFCSDLLHQMGPVEAITDTSVVDRFRNTLTMYQQGPFANYMPFTPLTEAQIESLAALQPRVCAAMHGSSYAGDGARALREVGTVIREILGSAEPR